MKAEYQFLIIALAIIILFGSLGLIASRAAKEEKRSNEIKIELDYGVTVYATIPKKAAKELTNDEWIEMVAEVKKAATASFTKLYKNQGNKNE